MKGNRLARVGSLTSTIYDLDAGTVTVIDRAKRRYAVMTVAAMQRWVEKGRGPGAATYITTLRTGRTMKIGAETASEYLITARAGSDMQSEVVAHAVYWIVEKLPSEELAAFRSDAWTSTVGSIRQSVPQRNRKVSESSQGMPQDWMVIPF